MSDAILEPLPAQSEPSQDTAENTLILAQAGNEETRFTADNASTMAKRSWEVRRKRNAAIEDAANAPQPEPQPDSYLVASVARVRAHILRVDERLSKATDALDIERLARARSALSEQERVLSGRPLPGALRPSGKVSRSAAGNVEPV